MEFICFYYHSPSSCARTDLTDEKKLVRVLHMSLVGVYKINIIPPMGEKVKFIPRQAAVWQTKFLSVRISYWDFSIYSNKTKQKKRYWSIFTFSKKPEWNPGHDVTETVMDTVLYLSNSLRNKNMKQTIETTHRSDEFLTPIVMGHKLIPFHIS